MQRDALLESKTLLQFAEIAVAQADVTQVSGDDAVWQHAERLWGLGGPQWERRAACAAARDGESAVVRLMVGGGGVQADQGLLVQAIRGGNDKVVQTVLREMDDPDPESSSSTPTPPLWDALTAAAAAGRVEWVNAVANRCGGDAGGVDGKDSTGHTALMAAAGAGHGNVVSELLTAGASVDGRADADGATALHAAARGGHADVVQQLIEAGADPWAVANDGVTPRMAAINARHGSVADLLASHGARSVGGWAARVKHRVATGLPDILTMAFGMQRHT